MPIMPNTATWRMADRLTGGTLADLIAAYRADALSPDQIASRLYAEHGVEVVGRTIRRWIVDIDGSAADGPEAA